MTSVLPPRIEARTFTPTTTLEQPREEPARVSFRPSWQSRLTPVGALVSAVSLSLLLGPILGVIGIGWVPITAFLWFIAINATLIRLSENGPAVKDRIWAIMLWSAGAVLISMLVLVIGYVLFRGWEVFKNLNWGDWRHTFFTTDMGVTGPLSPISQGGILHAIVGTLQQITIALVITVPLGIATAVFLNEIGGRYARLVRTICEAMTALPSVVAGLFIYGSVILLVTREFNGFAASLAISVLMLPIMIRAADVVLRLVPGNLREAGLALGAGHWSVVRRVVLPTVRSGLTTAIILATAHGIGETAPVLLTAGVTNNLNLNPFEGPQVSLPLQALEFVKSPQADMKARGFATAATLLVLVLILFVAARIVGGKPAGEISPRERRRRAARSLRDLPQIQANHDAVAAALDRSGDPR